MDDKFYVAYDFQCSICMKFSRVVDFFDNKKMIIKDDANDPVLEYFKSIPFELRKAEIVSYDPIIRKHYYGSDTLIQILKKIKLLNILLPIGMILKKMGFLDYLYKKIAQSTLRKKCHEGVCKF